MRPDSRKRRRDLRFETMEGRLLLSGVAGVAVHAARPAVIARARVPKITTDPAGVAAVLSALNGGPGHEFVTLINRELPNVGGVIKGFITGRYTQYSIRGLVAKVANAQPLYKGPGLDRMFLTEAGAV